jgi:2-octaprenyl-6-methoxyphenol hydroxylase
MFYDFIISGAGLAGILTYNILKKLGFSVYIFDKIKQQKEDNRTTTISYGSKLFLEKFGIWEDLEPFSTPILDIYTYEIDSTSYLHFDNIKDWGKSPMGYVIANQKIRDVLYKEVNIEHNKSYRNLYSSNEKVKLIFDDDKTIDGRFLIVAEGRNSNTIRSLGIPCFSRYYKQCSIICNLESEDEHENIAREIFLPTGPIALLPLQNKNQFSLIWTTKFDLSSSIKNSEENIFLNDISKISNIKFTKILTERVSYDLSLSFSLKCYKNNIIFIGDTIHTIHPVAGQGFNLTIYDLEKLSNILDKYGINNLSKFLKDYSAQSFKSNFQMLAFTDLLVKGFSNNSKIIKLGRNLVIEIINDNPKIRSFFIKRAMHVNSL